MSRTIREDVKKIIAASMGCCPGASVPIDCTYCGTSGRLAWVVHPLKSSWVEVSKWFEWDHHAPVSRGGDSRLGNVWPICAPCNRRKSDKIARDFAAEVSR